MDRDAGVEGSHVKGGEKGVGAQATCAQDGQEMLRVEQKAGLTMDQRLEEVVDQASGPGVDAFHVGDDRSARRCVGSRPRRFVHLWENPKTTVSGRSGGQQEAELALRNVP